MCRQCMQSSTNSTDDCVDASCSVIPDVRTDDAVEPNCSVPEDLTDDDIMTDCSDVADSCCCSDYKLSAKTTGRGRI